MGPLTVPKDQWIDGTMNSAMLNSVGLVPGTILEAITTDAQGVRDGTAIFQVLHRYPSEAVGFYVEVQYHGASSPAAAGKLNAVFATPGYAVLHGCYNPCSQCSQRTQWPGRHVLHSSCLRERSASSLIEPWVSPALRMAAAGSNATPGPHPSGGSASSSGTAAAEGSGELASGGPSNSATPEELQAKLKTLQKKLQERRSVGNMLSERAKKRSKKKKVSEKEDSSDSDDAGALFRGSSSRTHGDGIRRLAEESPGALLADGLNQIMRHLAGRGGASLEDIDELPAKVMTYLQSVWGGAHTTTEMGMRNAHELQMVGECLDLLLSGDLAQLGDTLMQRLKAIQQAVTDGHWNVARHLEILDRDGATLASPAERREAVRGELFESKIRESIGKARPGGGKGAQNP